MRQLIGAVLLLLGAAKVVALCYLAIVGTERPSEWIMKQLSYAAAFISLGILALRCSANPAEQ
ncbi:MAG: hypothetical protein KY476_22355 [Planctomycetes bacterium]|nr:hypothetical protein [Planctomycetota bacterium]